jgi:hypothetical protein
VRRTVLPPAYPLAPLEAAMSPGQVVLLLCLSVVALLFLLGGRNDHR